MKQRKLFLLGRQTQNEGLEKRGKKREELFFEYIFPNFQWNDLIRFRRVCKDAKELADKYIKSKGEKLCPEITIYESGSNKDKCLARFLELGFPAKSIYIMNTSGSAIFDKEAKNFAKFSEQSGPGSKITQVRIHKLNSPTVGNEKAFFEGLTNLKTLLVDEIGGGILSVDELEDLQKRARENQQDWPERFKQLKKVTVGVTPNIVNVDIFIASRFLMDFCSELEYCADAFSSATQLTLPNNKPQDVLGTAFGEIRNRIEKRGEEDRNKANLMYYDFDCFHKCAFTHVKQVEYWNSDEFLKLLEICVKHSVKLLNVNSAWLQKWQPNTPFGTDVALFPVELPDTNKITSPIVSVVNLHGLAIRMDMPNLEKLTIPATSRSSLLPKLWLRDRKPWPSLRILDVTVDSKMLYSTIVSMDDRVLDESCGVLDGSCGVLDPESTASLMKYLFVGIQRVAVTEVSLAFGEGVDVDGDTLKAATILGACCSNLKKLSLVNWPGTNASLIKVLGDVKALEELCLDNCKKIGDLAFLRTDTTDGLIQQHPGLKKLYLKQLDKMPKLTDALFQHVISRLKLSHLILSSNRPLNNITPNGIAALKEGEFAKTIEKFPFTGWSLENVSMAAFTKMKKQFRSHNMI